MESLKKPIFTNTLIKLSITAILISIECCLFGIICYTKYYYNSANIPIMILCGFSFLSLFGYVFVLNMVHYVQKYKEKHICNWGSHLFLRYIIEFSFIIYFHALPISILYLIFSNTEKSISDNYLFFLVPFCVTFFGILFNIIISAFFDYFYNCCNKSDEYEKV